MLLLLLSLVACASATIIEDYCWRDYDGTIPSDAFPAGLDRNGFPMYIGQTLYENKIIPGKILQNDTNIYVEWYGKEVTQSLNTKILCTEQQKKLEWVITDRQNLLQLPSDMQLIKGGFEPGYVTYLGRVLSDGETLVGKIVCNESLCYGLFTTKDGRTTEHYSFRVLTYNSKVKNVNKCDLPIDVRYDNV